MSILVIVCARNEEENIRRCLASILSQKYAVQKIVVVDDRSSDRTGEIIDEIAGISQIITTVKIRSDSIDEHVKRIPLAFNAGLEKVKLDEYDFVAKIDSDIELSNDYFERIIGVFNEDCTIGIAGGLIRNEPTREVCGANMVIRIKCWKQISDNCRMPIVDSEDAYLLVRAKMKKWKSIMLRDATSDTLRPFKSTSLKKKIRQRLRLGMTAYRFGYHPLYFIGRIIKLSFKEGPYVITPFIAIFGWALSWKRKDKHDSEFREFVRVEQKRVILGGRFS